MLPQDQHGDHAEEEPCPCSQGGVEADRPLEHTGYLVIRAAQQMDDLDRAAIAPEGAAGGQENGRGTGQRQQHDQRQRQPLQRRDRGEDGPQPAGLRIDPGVRRYTRQGGAQASQLVGRGIAAKAKVDQRRDRHGLARGARAQPWLQKLFHLLRRDQAHGGDFRKFGQRVERSLSLPCPFAGLCLDDLDGGTACQFVTGPARKVGQRQSGSGGNDGQRHHDRDHPRHRPGQPRLRHQLLRRAAAERR